MNHNIPIIVLGIRGFCEDCKKMISNEQLVTKKELAMFNVQPHAAFDFETLFQQFNEHKCSKQPDPPTLVFPPHPTTDP